MTIAVIERAAVTAGKRRRAGDDDRLGLSIDEAARVLSVSRASVYRLVTARKLTLLKILERRSIITMSSIRRLIGEPTSESRPAA